MSKIYNFSDWNSCWNAYIEFVTTGSSNSANSVINNSAKKEFCSYCGSQIFDTDRVCEQCGGPTKDSFMDREKLSKLDFIPPEALPKFEEELWR